MLTVRGQPLHLTFRNREPHEPPLTLPPPPPPLSLSLPPCTFSLLHLPLVAALKEQPITWHLDALRLPFPRSDMTSTLSYALGLSKPLIYIVGGCAADQGWIDFASPPDGTGMFACLTVTDRCDAYDPINNVYVACSSAPRPRYRHAAVEVDGYLFLLGGVNANDEVVKQVDKYDPVSDSWSVHGVWEDATTDLAAFVRRNVDHSATIFAVGGYRPELDYETTNRVTQIDPLKFSAVYEANPASRKNLKIGRGDIMAATSSTYAYVQGGYSSEGDNAWCETLPSVERYDFATGYWETIPSSQAAHTSSADGVLVAMSGSIYSIGGETKDNCDQTTTVAVKEVAVLSEMIESWRDATEIPIETFRFSAAAVHDTKAIYLFGGQNYYNEECNCFKVSDQVTYMKDSTWVVESFNSANRNSGGAGVLAAAAAAILAALMLF